VSLVNGPVDLVDPVESLESVDLVDLVDLYGFYKQLIADCLPGGSGVFPPCFLSVSTNRCLFLFISSVVYLTGGGQQWQALCRR
jgi:hypothetical protein